MTRCVECGTALKDMLEDEAPQYDPPKPPASEEPLLPPGEYRSIAGSLSSSMVSSLMRHFDAAGIPIKVESHGYTLRLSAREEDVPAAMAILAREEVVPKQPDATEPAVATEGGPCPACGTEIEPATSDCPECGLSLGGGPLSCEGCGAELSPADLACPACGRRQE
jgi:hypothetical protein